MSTNDPAAPAVASTADTTPAFDEIRIYSHSPLFYWWPVWAFGFIFALITAIDNNHLVILPAGSLVTREKLGEDKFVYTAHGYPGPDRMSQVIDKATDEQKNDLAKNNSHFKAESEAFRSKPTVSARSWMGPSYLILLLLVIVITSVPLRGLWSLVVMISLVVLALIISLMGWWDTILNSFIALHVFINLAGYLLLSTVLLIAWAVSTFVFDRRSYIVFTPGQIRVCEEIGSREKTYDTTGMTVEKHRDDWFRHVFLGFGSGDLSVRTAGADRNEIMMPNVAMIGFKIDPIQQLIRQRQVDSTPPRPVA